MTRSSCDASTQKPVSFIPSGDSFVASWFKNVQTAFLGTTLKMESAIVDQPAGATINGTEGGAYDDVLRVQRAATPRDGSCSLPRPTRLRSIGESSGAA